MTDILPPPKKKASWIRFGIEALLTAIAALIVVFLLTTFVVAGFYIPSASMQNTLQIGDRVWVWKPYNLTGGLQRGDVIVFKNPGGWLQNDPNNDGYLIKRVIGLPGDHVSCCDAVGNIQINGQSIIETYLGSKTIPSMTTFDVTVPKGDLWVMGDNRSNSDDSRYQAKQFVPESDVIGIAFVKFWPDFKSLDRHSDVFDTVPGRNPKDS